MKQIVHMEYQCKLHPDFKTNSKADFIEHLANHKIVELSVEERTKDMFFESGLIRTDLLL